LPEPVVEGGFGFFTKFGELVWDYHYYCYYFFVLPPLPRSMYYNITKI
jgi:hypothetical protein